MRITLPSGTPAEICRPTDGAEPSRGVVLLPDIGGLRPLFDELCQTLADDNGWVVCAPEPWPGREPLTVEEKLAAVHTLRDNDVLGDVEASAAACGVEPVGVVGFCMGGMYTFKAAGLGRFDKAVAFYGMIVPPDDWVGEDAAPPLDAVRADGAADVLAIIGTNDPYTPPDDVDALEAAGAEVVRYAGAEHGFVHAPERPAHRPDYAADAWRRTVAHLAVG